MIMIILMLKLKINFIEKKNIDQEYSNLSPEKLKNIPNYVGSERGSISINPNRSGSLSINQGSLSHTKQNRTRMSVFNINNSTRLSKIIHYYQIIY